MLPKCCSQTRLFRDMFKVETDDERPHIYDEAVHLPPISLSGFRLATALPNTPPARPATAAPRTAAPWKDGLNSPRSRFLRLPKYLPVPYKMLLDPSAMSVPTRTCECFLSWALRRRSSWSSSCRWCCGTSSDKSSCENRSMAMPSATNPRPVRIHARNVRSEARWSLATEPVFWYSGVPKRVQKGGGIVRIRRVRVLGESRRV